MVASGYISACTIVMHLNVRPASGRTFIFNICIRFGFICNGKRHVGSGWLSCRTNPYDHNLWLLRPISSATIIVNVPGSTPKLHFRMCNTALSALPSSNSCAVLVPSSPGTHPYQRYHLRHSTCNLIIAVTVSSTTITNNALAAKPSRSKHLTHHQELDK